VIDNTILPKKIKSGEAQAKGEGQEKGIFSPVEKIISHLRLASA
jgi:hypothetical protein